MDRHINKQRIKKVVKLEMFESMLDKVYKKNWKRICRKATALIVAVLFCVSEISLAAPASPKSNTNIAKLAFQDESGSVDSALIINQVIITAAMSIARMRMSGIANDDIAARMLQASGSASHQSSWHKVLFNLLFSNILMVNAGGRPIVLIPYQRDDGGFFNIAVLNTQDFRLNAAGLPVAVHSSGKEGDYRPVSRGALPDLFNRDPLVAQTADNYHVMIFAADSSEINWGGDALSSGAETEKQNFPIRILDPARTERYGIELSRKDDERKNIGSMVLGSTGAGTNVQIEGGPVTSEPGADETVGAIAALTGEALDSLIARSADNAHVRAKLEKYAPLLQKNNVRVEIVEDSDALIDIIPILDDLKRPKEGEFVMRIDSDWIKAFEELFEAAESDAARDRLHLGRQTLLEMAIVHELDHVYGGMSERQAVHQTLDFDHALNDDEREALRTVLEGGRVDSGNVFRHFLHMTNDKIRAEGVDSAFISEGLAEARAANDTAWVGRMLIALSDNKRVNISFDRVAVLEILNNLYEEKIDPDQAALEINTILQRALDQERDWWVGWLIVHHDHDSPYDTAKARAIIEEYQDKGIDQDTMQERIAELFQDYAPDIDAERAQDMIFNAHESGQDIFAMRYSRAGRDEGVLWASAKHLEGSQAMLDLADEIENEADGIIEVSGYAMQLVNRLRSGLPTSWDMLISMASDIQKAANEYQSKGVEHIREKTKSELQRREREQRMRKIDPDELARQRQELLDETEDQIRRFQEMARKLFLMALEFQLLLEGEKKQDAAITFYLQRMTHTGLPNVTFVNEAYMEPGRPEKITIYESTGRTNSIAVPDGIGISAPNTTNTASAVVIENSSRVGVPTPLFIGSHTIEVDNVKIPQTYIAVEGLVTTELRNAEYFANNVWNVMQSEYLTLARRMLYHNDQDVAQAVQQIMRQEEEAGQKIDLDEAIRLYVRSLDADSPMIQTISALTGLIGESHWRLINEVNDYRSSESTSRIDAIEAVIVSDKGAVTDTKKNLFARVKVNTKDGAVDFHTAVKTTRTNTLKGMKTGTITRQRFENISSMAAEWPYKRQRKKPALDIMTTQAPGLTEGLIDRAIEEEMALYNIIRWTDGLQQKYDEEYKSYFRQVVVFGNVAVESYGKERERDQLANEILKEKRFFPDSTPELRRALAVEEATYRMVEKYRELGQEVAILAVMHEKEGREVTAWEPLDGIPNIQELDGVVKVLSTQKSAIEVEAAAHLRRTEGKALEDDLIKYVASTTGAINDPDLERHQNLTAERERLTQRLNVLNNLETIPWYLEKLESLQPYPGAVVSPSGKWWVPNEGHRVLEPDELNFDIEGIQAFLAEIEQNGIDINQRFCGACVEGRRWVDLFRYLNESAANQAEHLDRIKSEAEQLQVALPEETADIRDEYDQVAGQLRQIEEDLVVYDELAREHLIPFLNESDIYRPIFNAQQVSEARKRFVGNDPRLRSWKFERIDRAKSTARKAVVARAGLNHLTLNEHYNFKSTGRNKTHDVVYTPSRVDLGLHEYESVAVFAKMTAVRATPEDLSKPIETAKMRAQEAYRIFNANTETDENERIGELRKTLENGIFEMMRAVSDAGARMINVQGVGDFDMIAADMTDRGDRIILNAGEGCAGYCMPKDILFQAYIQTMSQTEKMVKMGVPEEHRKAIQDLCLACLHRKEEMGNDLEWVRWAAKELENSGFKKYFEEYYDIDENGYPVFNLPGLAYTLANMGQVWPEASPENYRMYQGAYGAWVSQRTFIALEQVMRAMSADKAMLIRETEAHAKRLNPGIQLNNWEDAVVVLSAPYKSPTSNWPAPHVPVSEFILPPADIRYTISMRIFEWISGIGSEHQLNFFDEDGQALFHLMFNGFSREIDTGASPARQRLERTARRKLEEWFNDRKKGNNEFFELMEKVFPPMTAPRAMRQVATNGVPASELLGWASESQAKQIAESLEVELNELGLLPEAIEANVRRHEADLDQWSVPASFKPGGLKNKEWREFKERNRGNIHALVLSVNGTIPTYQEALVHSDTLNLGIPEQHLMHVLSDFPALISRMLHTNPGSYLALTDGPSQNRRRALYSHDVMEFFAAANNVAGREAVYLSPGVGTETIESDRAKMKAHRARAEKLLETLKHFKRAYDADKAESTADTKRELAAARNALAFKGNPVPYDLVERRAEAQAKRDWAFSHHWAEPTNASQRRLDEANADYDQINEEYERIRQQGIVVRIQDQIINTDAAEDARKYEKRMREFGKYRPRDTDRIKALSNVSRRVPLEQWQELGAAEAIWLHLGGNYLAIGRPQDEIDQMFDELNSSLEAYAAYVEEHDIAAEPVPGKSFSEKDQRRIRGEMKPFAPFVGQGEAEQSDVEGSVKAVEEEAKAVGRRREMILEQQRVQNEQERKQAFAQAAAELGLTGNENIEELLPHSQAVFGRISEVAAEEKSNVIMTLDERQKRSRKLNELYGQYLYLMQTILKRTIAQDDLWEGALKDPAKRKEAMKDIISDIDALTDGANLDLELIGNMLGGYQYRGHLAQLMHLATPDNTNPNKALLKQLTSVAGVFYEAYALETTIEYAQLDPRDVSGADVTKDLAQFFSKTIDDHFYPYKPWAISRSPAFNHYTENELFALAINMHQGLYPYMQGILRTKTSASKLPEDELDALLGNNTNFGDPAGGYQGQIGIGARGYTGEDGTELAQLQWRAYGQLREFAFRQATNQDSFAPPVFTTFNPAVIDGENAVVRVIGLPSGRPHYDKEEEEGVGASRQMLEETGHPEIIIRSPLDGQLYNVGTDGDPKWIMAVHDGYMQLSEAQYRLALKEKGMNDDDINRQVKKDRQIGRLTSKGIRVALRFGNNPEGRYKRPDEEKQGEPYKDYLHIHMPIPFHGDPAYHGRPMTRAEAEALGVDVTEVDWQARADEQGVSPAEATINVSLFEDVIGYPNDVMVSRFWFDAAYNKSVYPDMFGQELLPDEIDWQNSWTTEITEDYRAEVGPENFDENEAKARVMEKIINGWHEKGWVGLKYFAEDHVPTDATPSLAQTVLTAYHTDNNTGIAPEELQARIKAAERPHPEIIKKGAEESGARNLEPSSLTFGEGGIEEEGVSAAAAFIYDVSQKQPVTVQEVMTSLPELLFTDEAMEGYRRRKAVEDGVAVSVDQQNFFTNRVIAMRVGDEEEGFTYQNPLTGESYRYQFFFVNAAFNDRVETNKALGGKLFELRPDMIREEHRESFLKGLIDASEESMKRMEAYGQSAWEAWADEQEAKNGIRPRAKDARGVPYAQPNYIMLDTIAAPNFKRPGQFAGYDLDDKGNYIPILRDTETGELFKGEFVDEGSKFRFTVLEPNVGLGQHVEVTSEQERRFRALSQAQGLPYAPGDEVGTNDRIFQTTAGKMGLGFAGTLGIAPAPLPAEAKVKYEETIPEDTPAEDGGEGPDPMNLARNQTLDELRVVRQGDLTTAQLSLVLMHYAENVLYQNWPLINDRNELRRQRAEELRQDGTDNYVRQARDRLSEILDNQNVAQILRAAIGSEAADAVAGRLGHSAYRARVVEAALNMIFSEHYSPQPLLVAAESMSLDEAARRMAGSHNVAVTFNADLGFPNELYQLIHDARQRDLAAHNAPYFNVFGVRADWINGRRVNRIIFYDHDLREFVETDVDGLYGDNVEVVQPLYLGENEAELHRDISDWTEEIGAANPMPGDTALVLDSKGETFKRLVQANVSTPHTTVINGLTGELEDTIDDFIKKALVEEKLIIDQHGREFKDGDRTLAIIIQPEAGTEGVGAIPLDIKLHDVIVDEFTGEITGFTVDPRDFETISSIVRQARKQGEVIIRRAVGETVRYHSDGISHHVDLRMNVTPIGDQYAVDSARGQIADKDSRITSVSQGGRLAGLQETLTHLTYIDAGGNERKLELSDSHYRDIAREVRNAARVLGLNGLAGIDVRLDVYVSKSGEVRVFPWILDVNPRPVLAASTPAGYSRTETHRDRPYATGLYWDHLEALIEGTDERVEPSALAGARAGATDVVRKLPRSIERAQLGLLDSVRDKILSDTKYERIYKNEYPHLEELFGMQSALPLVFLLREDKNLLEAFLRSINNTRSVIGSFVSLLRIYEYAITHFEGELSTGSLLRHFQNIHFPITQAHQILFAADNPHDIMISTDDVLAVDAAGELTDPFYIALVQYDLQQAKAEDSFLAGTAQEGESMISLMERLSRVYGYGGVIRDTEEQALLEWLGANYNDTGRSIEINGPELADLRIWQHADMFSHLIGKAVELGFLPQAECYCVRTPGRVRYFAGRPDRRSLGGESVNAATHMEMKIVLQPTETGQVELYNINRKFMVEGEPATFDLNAPDVTTGDQVDTFLDWDEWTKTIFEPKLDAGELANKPDDLIKGLIAYMRTDYVIKQMETSGHTDYRAKLDGLKGLKVLIRSDIPTGGGFSTSSTLVMGVAQALNNMLELELTDEEIINLGFAEFYTNVRAGTADHAAIIRPDLGAVVSLGSFPNAVKGQNPFPGDWTMLVADSGLPRDQEETKAASAKLQQVTPGDIKGRTGAAPSITALILRALHPEHEAGMLAHPTDNPFGLLREFNFGGTLDDGTGDEFAEDIRIYKLLAEIPLRATRDELRQILIDNNRTDLLDNLNSLFSHTEPEDGYRLRDYALFAWAENQRTRLFFTEAVPQADADFARALMARSHDGDRISSWENPSDDGALESAFAPELTDEDIERYLAILSNPGDHTPEEVLEARLWNNCGFCERSLEQIDRMVDIINEEFGDAAQARVSAAGLGGAVVILITDKSKAVEVRNRLTELYYSRFNIPIVPGETFIEVTPGAGTSVVPAQESVSSGKEFDLAEYTANAKARGAEAAENVIADMRERVSQMPAHERIAVTLDTSIGSMNSRAEIQSFIQTIESALTDEAFEGKVVFLKGSGRALTRKIARIGRELEGTTVDGRTLKLKHIIAIGNADERYIGEYNKLSAQYGEQITIAAVRAKNDRLFRAQNAYIPVLEILDLAMKKAFGEIMVDTGRIPGIGEVSQLANGIIIVQLLPPAEAVPGDRMTEIYNHQREILIAA